MIKKFLCFIGWHKWSWNLSSVNRIDNSIPPNAKCERCGIKNSNERA